MHVVEDTEAVRSDRCQDSAASWGLVPTMGALHEGHLSLIRRARRENDRTAVSIFVNPIQFDTSEDLNTYPRDLSQDLSLLEKEGVDLVWIPTNDVVYPPGYQTYVICEELSLLHEEVSRPGHFRGVCTIVTKLFNLFQPRAAYFGQKDVQQALMIKRLVNDLNFNLEIKVCPTVREADGLAMSSRNLRLSPEERKSAGIIYPTLERAKNCFNEGERDSAYLCAFIRDKIETEPPAAIDYVSIVDPETLKDIERIGDCALILLAVFVGRTRLIDNMYLVEDAQ